MLTKDDLKWLSERCPTPSGVFHKADKIQKRALKTWISTGRRTLDIMKAATGVARNGSELSNLFNRAIFNGKQITREKILDEAGNILYYLSILLYELGITVEELSKLNRHKMKSKEKES